MIIGDVRERAQRALRSVLSQDIAEQIVVLIYDRADTPADFPELSAPNVTYEWVGKNTTLGVLQKRAVQTATTDIIAFLEEHTVAPPEWARESLRLHSLGNTGITGFFLSGNSNHYWARVAFEVTYGDYVLSRKMGETFSIPGDNSTFVRSKILRYQDDLELFFNTDILLIRRLLADGEKLYRGNFGVYHYNESKMSGAWWALCYWSQMYICNIMVVERWSFIRRLLRLCAVPLVPFVRTYYNFKMAKLNAVAMKQFVADLPAAFLMNSGSAAGIAAGLLFGLQQSEYRFADCETCAERLD